MKRTLAIASVLATGIIGSTAHAQSSVTLYGTLDTGLDWVSNQRTPNGSGKNAAVMESGNLSRDVWGLRGSEDLGGGLHAIFNLESDFNIGNGRLNDGGSLFGRQANVGLSSDQYGTLTLGRQSDFMVDFVAPLSATGDQGFGGNLASHPFDNDNLDDDAQMNNAVKYTSPTYAGFTAGAEYAFSNRAGGFSNNDAFSAGARWQGGPATLAVGYVQANNPGGLDTTPANTGGALATTDEDGMMTGGRQRTFGASGQYLFGPATVGLVFTRTMLDAPSSIAQGGGYVPLNGHYLSFNNYEVNARYALTPMLSVGGAYTFTDGHFGTAAGGSADPRWNQFMLQADYSLSRRTDVYVEGVYQRVSGRNGIGGLGNASIYNLAASANDRQAVVGVGLRHRF